VTDTSTDSEVATVVTSLSCTTIPNISITLLYSGTAITVHAQSAAQSCDRNTIRNCMALQALCAVRSDVLQEAVLVTLDTVA
jgi:hypothetical protein